MNCTKCDKFYMDNLDGMIHLTMHVICHHAEEYYKTDKELLDYMS